MKRREFIANTGAIIGSSLFSKAESMSKSTSSPKFESSDPMHSDGSSGVPQAIFRQTRSTKSATSAALAAASTALTLDQLHTLMAGVCQDSSGNQQVGAFFRINWLVNNLKNEFLQAAQAISKIVYQTPFTNVNAGLVVDLSRTDLTIDAAGQITLTKFSPVIVLTDPHNQVYDKIEIDFDPVLLKLGLDTTQAGRLRFYLTTNDPSDPHFPKFATNPIGANPPSVTTPDPAVIANNGYTAQTYSLVEAGIKASAAPIDILDSFVSSLPLVAIVEAMRQFAIETPLSFHFEQGYVIVHGPSVVSPPDPCGPMAGTTISTTVSPSAKPPTASTPTSPAENGFKFDFKHSVTAVAATTVVGSPAPPIGYFYPLQWTFEDFANTIIGPGVVASDSGDAFLFHWSYQLSARPKLKSIQVTVPANPSATGFLAMIKIDAPLDVGGGAGVSMKVGCVTVPLLSSTILGSVDPSVITLLFTIVNTGRGPEVVVTAQYNCAVDISFYGPPMIDILLNVLMGSFGNRLVAGELREMVNSLTFPLLNLSALEYKGGGPGLGWRLDQDFRAKSVLMTLEEGEIEHRKTAQG